MKAKNIISFFVIATIIKFWANAFCDNDLNWDAPKDSVASSQFWGTFKCPVRATPNTFEYNHTKISFKEAWIERRVKTEYVCVWFYRHKFAGDCILCFTLDQGKEVFDGIGAPPLFMINGTDNVTFGSENFNQLFFCDNLPSDFFSKHQLQVSLVTKWTDGRDHPITFSW